MTTDADRDVLELVEDLLRNTPDLRRLPRDVVIAHARAKVSRDRAPPALTSSVNQDRSGAPVPQGSQVPSRGGGIGVPRPPNVRQPPPTAPGVPIAGPPAELPAEPPEGPLLALLDADLPLDDYVAGLFVHADVLGAGLLGWQSPVFALARWAKAHPRLTTAPAAAAWAAFARAAAALGPDQDDVWRDYFGCTAEDAEVTVIHTWTRIRSLPTADPLEYALELADAYPLPLPPSTRPRSAGYGRFVGLVAFLQRNVGTKRSIFLPTKRVGQLLGIEPKSASRYCQWAVEDGFLARVAPAVFNPRGRAADYRFDLGKLRGLGDGGV